MATHQTSLQRTTAERGHGTTPTRALNAAEPRPRAERAEIAEEANDVEDLVSALRDEELFLELAQHLSELSEQSLVLRAQLGAHRIDPCRRAAASVGRGGSIGRSRRLQELLKS
eukprot:CAMPEP_0115863046 /NCGR_PEP_ID=MMETSP0287-20121206/18493_1 /TAXON_ID=412157 /ORGANISM="Chrysochromulina rotalis, Strain UIO044" /LENGTH=113 /DNA_ID=CAMNT_0003317493 /DNA_START=253 /DNA_END=591 /DNA_ORIENTATION=-